MERETTGVDDPEDEPGSRPGSETERVGAPGDVRPLTAEQQALVAMGMSLLAPCAASVARWFRDLGVTPAELLGPGAIGLREAALAYDPQRPTSFLVYARHHVRGRMAEAVRVDHFSQRARIERAMERSINLCEAHQVPEVAASGDQDEGTVAETQRGLDEALAASFVAAVRAMERESSEEVTVARIAIRQGMNALSAPEREVVRLYFEEGLTLDEVAERMGVHWNTAQRRYASALRKLRAVLAGAGSEPPSGP